jgi:peptidoglycan hydrolase-like protein with peptidoglycan-binding domain
VRGTRLDFPRYSRLRTGSTGPRVRALQCLLRTNAHYRGRLDARFDRDVARTVKTFQRRHDLRVTGKADTATWTALFARGSAPLLKVGSSGAAVLRLQRTLRAAGSRSVEHTGVVSERTAKAVARYQRRLGTDPTGVVTTDTWTALQQGRR